jgi:hypothetical protein
MDPIMEGILSCSLASSRGLSPIEPPVQIQYFSSYPITLLKPLYIVLPSPRNILEEKSFILCYYELKFQRNFMGREVVDSNARVSNSVRVSNPVLCQITKTPWEDSILMKEGVKEDQCSTQVPIIMEMNKDTNIGDISIPLIIGTQRQEEV